MSLKVEILGVEKAIASMQSLAPAIRIKWMRQALNAACGVIKDRIVASAPKDTGLLAKSQRVKVAIPQASRNPAHHDKPAWGLVGAGRGLTAVITRRGKAKILTGKNKASAKLAGTKTKRASRYAHFAEKGRKGKGGTHFMRDAATATASAAHAKFAAKIAQGIKEEAAKLASKP